MNPTRKNPITIMVRKHGVRWCWALMRNIHVLAMSPEGYTTKRKCVMELERIISDLKSDCVTWAAERPKKASTLLSQIAGLERKQP